jgi:hypothetical protein
VNHLPGGPPFELQLAAVLWHLHSIAERLHIKLCATVFLAKRLGLAAHYASD